MGGPMMGFSLSNNFVPVIKTTNCILVPSIKEMPSAFTDDSAEVECIRCGQCSDVCPSQLLPQELQWSAKAKDYPQLAKLNLSDCIECGACAYVCPSQIPLVQYYRVAKAEIRTQQLQDLKAEKAKIRFETRKVRLEKEKTAREEKHKKAAAARKAAMNKNTPEAVGAKSAVAAALARVKAKKAQDKLIKPADNSVIADEKDQVKSAIARAKAKKLAKMKGTQVNDLIPDSVQKVPVATADKNQAANSEVSQENNKKEKIATAIAKAKAKKLERKEQVTSGVTETITVDENDKKAKVAAAIAKAKAKKLAQEEQVITENSEQEVLSKDNKKAKLAGAIAKAKAKAAKKINDDDNQKPEPSISQVNSKTSNKQQNEST